ncbi:hypothetical protein CKA32_005361 [Geitlerinema sp. FC II]|nr:hypothetical protein CKA32_005361 [Geitlerinema sp. FC II]
MIYFGEEYEFQFAAFFCLSVFCFSQALIQIINISKYKQTHKKQQRDSTIIVHLIYGILFFLVGIIHTLGKLDFPEILVSTDWNNRYILYIRFLFLMAWLLESFIIYNEELQRLKQRDKKNFINLSSRIKLIFSSFNLMLFTPLSIPIMLSVIEVLK